jgi:hypothetical protein
MSVFGKSPLGTGPGPFGGPGLITVLGVLPQSNNQFVVVFDTEPKTLDPQSAVSASNEENFALQAIDPTLTADDGTVIVPKGEVVPTRFPYTGVSEQDQEDPTQIICTTDSALQPGVRYQVTISPTICGADGETFVGPDVFAFRAPGLSRQLSFVQISEERYRDFDYIINPQAGEVGQTYRQEANGDIGIQDAQTSLRKRIYRRIFTDPGGFAWAPGYGVGVRVKALAKTQRLQELASIVSEQVSKEPDVINVGTEVFIDRQSVGTFLQIECFVQQRDSRARRFTFQEPLR